MPEQKDKITLICTSLNPNPYLLRKMLHTAVGFDEIILHLDAASGLHFNIFDTPLTLVSNPSPLSIPDAYNWIIREHVKTQWVCCMCDDDYFYPEGLSNMISEVKEGIVAGVAHFKFHVSGHVPKEDKRCWFGKKEYDLWEPRPVTAKLLKKHNRLPAVSFFRKAAWELAGGFSGKFEHDRVLWTKMAEVGVEFKFFPHLVYNFCRREKSAWHQQKMKNKKMKNKYVHLDNSCYNLIRR